MAARRRRVVEVDKLSGRIIGNYSTVMEASRMTGVSEGAIRYQVSSGNHLPVGWSMFRWEGDNTYIDFRDRPNIPVLAFDGRNKLAFANANQACKALEISLSKFKNHCGDRARPILFNGAHVYLEKAKKMGDYKGFVRYGFDR